jgi:hypothetical protein
MVEFSTAKDCFDLTFDYKEIFDKFKERLKINENFVSFKLMSDSNKATMKD